MVSPIIDLTSQNLTSLAAGRNVILDMDFPEIFKYQVDRNAPLPTGEPLEKIDEEAYPEEYHGPKESSDADDRVYPKKS